MSNGQKNTLAMLAQVGVAMAAVWLGREGLDLSSWSWDLLAPEFVIGALVAAANVVMAKFGETPASARARDR